VPKSAITVMPITNSIDIITVNPFGLINAFTVRMYQFEVGFISGGRAS
jgi:hypothetical protein